MLVETENQTVNLLPSKGRRARPLFDPPIVKRAVWDSVAKLNPRTMMKNPVMFVVEVGAALTTVLVIRDWRAAAPDLGFTFQITLWLWFTVLFANFAEAMAEGRGKAQADTLRKTKTETVAHRLMNGTKKEDVAASQLRQGDLVV
jgi:K+-transporting ATPase ATPase B chain